MLYHASADAFHANAHYRLPMFGTRCRIGAAPYRRTIAVESQTTKMLIKMPLDAKAWLKSEAARNISSQQAEIVRSIRERMERAQEKAAR